MRPSFALHGRLAQDSMLITELTLCQARLLNDRRYPWVILVPMRPDIFEVHQLSTAEQQQLIAESSQVSQVLEDQFKPDSINVAALGNVVSQLHWHVVARKQDDPAWPGPIWGVGTAEPYSDNEAHALIEWLAQAIGEQHKPSQ